MPVTLLQIPRVALKPILNVSLQVDCLKNIFTNDITITHCYYYLQQQSRNFVICNSVFLSKSLLIAPSQEEASPKDIHMIKLHLQSFLLRAPNQFLMHLR